METHLNLQELITFSHEEIKEIAQYFGVRNKYAYRRFATVYKVIWDKRLRWKTTKYKHDYEKQAYKNDYEKLAQIFIIICTHVTKYFITFLTIFNDIIFIKEWDRCFFKFGMISPYSSTNKKMFFYFIVLYFPKFEVSSLRVREVRACLILPSRKESCKSKQQVNKINKVN